MADRTVSVSLVARVSGYVGGIATAGAATKEFSGELDKLAKNHKERFNSITRTTAIAGLALTGVFAAAVKAGMNFDKTMSEVASVSGATGKSLTDLSNAALKAGKDTAFTASDAAKAEAELAKAGISTADILGGALAGALSLAAAGQMDLADAATLSAQAMNIFKLNGSAVPHIADVLASAANTSAADMQGLGDALKQAGLVAAGTGASLEDTVGVLAAFADNALSGSDAGTSLKTMLGQLQGASDKSKALMKDLGISAYDTAGNFIGLTRLAGNLQTSLGKLTQKERDEALAQIFGNDGRRAAAILYDQGAAGIAKYITQVDQSGAASATAAQKMNNLSGDLEQLKGSLETMAITSSGGARDGLRQLTQAATGLVNEFMDLPGWLQQSVVELSGITGVSLLLVAGFLKARGALKDFQKTLEDMGPLGTKLSGLTGKVAKLGVAAGIAAVAGFGIYELFKHMSDAGKPAAMNLDDVTSSLNAFALTGKATGDMAKTFGVDLGNVTAKAKELDAALKTSAIPVPMSREVGAAIGPHQKAVDAANRIQQAFKDTDAGLKTMVDNGQTAAATQDFQVFTKQLLAAGWSMDRINATFPEYTKAAGDAALSTNATAQGFATATEKTGILTMSLEDAIKAYGSLINVQKALNGANISMIQAEDALQASYDAATDSIKQNGQTAIKNHTVLDATTAKGRANREALLGIVDAATKAAQATLDQTGSLEKANAVIDKARDKFIKDAEAMGLSEEAARKLADSLFKIPSVNPKVNVTGLDAALVKVGNLVTQIAKIKGKDVTIGIHSNIAGPNPFTSRWGNVYTHAADGALRHAQTFSAVAGPGARYAFAEGGTGGEGFVPKNGDYARSMGIMQTMAGWYGAHVVPGRTRGGDGASAPVTYHSEMNVYAQNADPAILDQYQRTMEIRQRVGRPR